VTVPEFPLKDRRPHAPHKRLKPPRRPATRLHPRHVKPVPKTWKRILAAFGSMSRGCGRSVTSTRCRPSGTGVILSAMLFVLVEEEGCRYFRGCRADSALATNSEAETFNTSASCISTSTFGLWIPRSTKLINDLSKPAASASCSWESSLCSRASRSTCPKAHFGPMVGWICARFRTFFRLAKRSYCGVNSV
jgi:hypothetical protein